MQKTKDHKLILIALAGKCRGNAFRVRYKASIGRTEENDIHVSDQSVSRTHTLIQKQEDGSVRIRDLASKNGTLLNGKKIDHADLQIGDLIEIGENKFRCLAEPALHLEKPPQWEQMSVKARLAFLLQTPRGRFTSLMASLATPIVVFALLAYAVPFSQNPIVQAPSDTSSSQTSETLSPGEALLPDPDGEVATSESSNPSSQEATPAETALPVSKSDIEDLKQKMESALTMSDYIGAYIALDKLQKALPEDPVIAERYDQTKKKLRKDILKHEENGIREYEKLNYDKAITEWQKGLSLAKELDKDLYQKLDANIKEANTKLAELSNSN